MGDDKFEIRPDPFKGDGTFHIQTPDFGAQLQKDTQDAERLKGASGFLAKGLLPDIQLALQETGHKPDDKVHKQVPGIGQLDLVYDDKGKLASARLDYGHGSTESATYVDGHIVENRLQGLFNADYHFNSDGTIASELFEPQPNASQYYEFDEKGNVTLGASTNADHSTSLLINEPGSHDIEENGANGNRSMLHYDNNQQLQGGEVTTDGKIYGVKPDKTGGATAVPETEL